MLSKKYKKSIYNSLLPVELIRPYPGAMNRSKWENLSEELIVQLNERCERYIGTKNNPLKGTLLQKAFESGDYEEIKGLYNSKINKLISLTLAECIEYKGVYTEEVLDTVWSVCDMAVWHASAGQNEPLQPVIDEYSVKTGFLLAYVWYLLQDQFESLDVNVKTRFTYEIKRRIMKPFMDNGYIPETSLLGGILFTFLMFEEDYRTRHAAVVKTMEAADEVLKSDSVITDGLIKYLDIIYMSTDGVFDVFSDIPLSKLMEADLGNYTSWQLAAHLKKQVFIKKAYKSKDENEYIRNLMEDIPIDESLFIIFNHDLIANRLYIGEDNDA